MTPNYSTQPENSHVCAYFEHLVFLLKRRPVGNNQHGAATTGSFQRSLDLSLRAVYYDILYVVIFMFLYIIPSEPFGGKCLKLNIISLMQVFM